MTLSQMVKTAIENAPGQTIRTDVDPVRQELSKLGINENSEFGRFFLDYSLGTIPPSGGKDYLIDICSPSADISRTTEWLRDIDHEFYADYVALTTFEAEGGYMYNINSGAVVDHEWPDKIVKSWDSWNEFLEWYFNDGNCNPTICFITPSPASRGLADLWRWVS